MAQMPFALEVNLKRTAAAVPSAEANQALR
jgi:hypothetical protein